MDERYQKTDDEQPKRAYIIENVKTSIGPSMIKTYGAYRQDYEGFTDRGERALGYADTIGELIIYVTLHYPGAVCVAVWPPGENDGSYLTDQMLELNGLPNNAKTD